MAHSVGRCVSAGWFYPLCVFLGRRGDTCRCALATARLAKASILAPFAFGNSCRTMVATSSWLSALMAEWSLRR